MKKIAVGFAAVMFSTMVLVPSQATTPKALVIIDSYFDSKVSASNVKCITLANTECTDVVKVTTPSLSHSINHGNAMAEVAKKQNSSLPITLLRSAPASARSVAEVNAGNFIDALNWVNNNSSTVGAVSVSRFFGHANGTCRPNSVNTAPHGGVAKADATIRSLILTLKSKNIPVFVSTGNAPKKTVGYPACIADTVSVTSPGNTSDAFTDVSASLNNNAGIWNFNSPVLGLIPQTTSSATVAVAAQYLGLGLLPAKVVLVNP
jgi:hypothetical protein